MSTRSLRFWAIVVCVLAALGILVWAFRIELLLAFIEYRAGRALPVEPTREITWEAGPSSPVYAPDRPPNIVLILADDLGWNDLSFNGGGIGGGAVRTPHIDSIARDGVNFIQGYAANATCAPSRAALMSGRYSTRFGFEFTPTPPSMMPMMRMMRNASDRAMPPMYFDDEADSIPYQNMGMPPEEITLAELLRDRGYHTAHIGKWHLGRTGGMSPMNQGFNESLLMASGLYGSLDDPDIVQARQDFDPIDRFLWRALRFAASFNGSPVFEPPRYLTDYYTDEAVRVIEANRNRPFFLYLAHWAPHTPLQAAREDYDALPQIELHRERVYGAMVRALDRGVGRVLETLRANGLEENTLVMFTSDNGGAGYIGLPDVNHPLRGWKMSLFEGGIRVPFFVKWPRAFPGGLVFTPPVHHFDLYATAAAAAGAPLPDDRRMDGVDLHDYVLARVEGSPHERLFWRSGAAASVRQGRYKLTVSEPPGGERRHWLFDLEADPEERRDLAAQLPAVAAELQSALDAHNAEQAQPIWPSLIDTPLNVDRDLSQPDAAGDTFAYWSN